MLWAAERPSQLPHNWRNAIKDPTNQLWISAITAWEIALKAKLGRLSFTADDFRDAVRDLGRVGRYLRTSFAAGALPLHHRDPFDRMLGAQAQIEGLSLVSAGCRYPQLRRDPALDRCRPAYRQNLLKLARLSTYYVEKCIMQLRFD